MSTGTDRRLPLHCRPDDVSHARHWVRAQLAARPDVPRETVDDAELVVSELVTNALRAGCREASLDLAVTADCVRVSVDDDAQGVPAIRVAGPAAGHGRGLPIIAALCQDWGVEATPRGKQVWAQLWWTPA